MIRDRRARIVATLGPASNTPEMVEKLARAGADVFRLNFSHGAHGDHQISAENVRAAEAA
ncbi:MAG: pyruvate kinase, partial [Proteobacteria bacterium]|nr:pyruvate kinase [Pseudomonadota bacterium]